MRPRKRRRCLGLVVALLLVCAAPRATDLESGTAAFRSGDYAIALGELTPLARQGNSVAQLHLGLMFAAGLGVERNDELAVSWYRRAAVQGGVRAQYRLALAHAFGVGVAQNNAEAVRWYRAAAEQGHLQAQLQLGFMLGSATSGELLDHDEAVRWLTAAAEQGDASAQLKVGQLYAEGDEIDPNPGLAVRWLHAAALQDRVEAQYELGLIYEYGRGVQRDLREARTWYAMAAAGGMASARERMGFDPRLRSEHLRRARIFDGTGPGSPTVRSPDEIRHGPAAPVELSTDRDVVCEFFPRDNHGGNPKFRCFMMTARLADGGHFYDEHGQVRPAARGVLIPDLPGGGAPVLAVDEGAGGLVPLTDRVGFRRRAVRPLELKVKYRSLVTPQLLLERDMHSEVAATRLFWALGYPADRMYRVRSVECHRCPRDPFENLKPAAVGTYTVFDEAAVELRYEAGRAEKYQSWLRGGWSWGDELRRLRYAQGSAGFTDEQKMHFDGLVVLMSLIQNASKRPTQNRLICLRGKLHQFAGAFKICPDAVLMVNDLGSAFGKRQLDSLNGWRDWQIWEDIEACESALPLDTHDEYRVERYVIGEAGRRFILGLLEQLSEEHLRALFQAAEFGRYDFTLVPPGKTPPPELERELIDAWIGAFRDKVGQLRTARCAG